MSPFPPPPNQGPDSYVEVPALSAPEGDIRDGVIADEISKDEAVWSRAGPHPIHPVFLQRGGIWRQAHTWGELCRKTGTMLPQATEHARMLERGLEGILSIKLLEGAWP